MEMLEGVWKQHLRPRAVVGYSIKILLPGPPNYVTRSPGGIWYVHLVTWKKLICCQTVIGYIAPENKYEVYVPCRHGVQVSLPCNGTEQFCETTNSTEVK